MADWKPAGAPVPVTPDERLRAIGAPVPIQETPEQRYEGLVKKLPKAARYVAPGTMGEAGFGLGSLASAGAGLVLAPESMGASLAMAAPLVGAVAGGALEDPAHRLRGALWEGGKGLATELGGRLVSKGGELATRALSKNAMLNKSAERIAGAIPGLFSEYPLKTAPRTAEELQDQLGRGKVAQAAGARVGAIRNEIRQKFGNEFIWLPDIDKDGNQVMRQFDVGGGVDHVRELFEGSRSASGSQKAVAGAGKALDTAQSAQTILTSKLNQLEQGLGTKYSNISHDFGVAKQLEKVFSGSTRTTSVTGGSRGVIDQPKVLKKAEQAAAKLNQIRSEAGTKLTKAVAPTGAEAVREMGPGIRAHVGDTGIKSMLHPPVPFKPEDRSMLPAAGRFFSDPRLSKAYGYLLQRLAEAGQQ